MAGPVAPAGANGEALIMSNLLASDLPGLKRMAKDFLDALPTATLEEADAGLKCFHLGYLNLEANDLERYQATILFQLISRKYTEREAELLAQEQAA